MLTLPVVVPVWPDFLNSKAVNLAFVSIGVDYFQVLAMFANSRVQWPVMIKDVRDGCLMRCRMGVMV